MDEGGERDAGGAGDMVFRPSWVFNLALSPVFSYHEAPNPERSSPTLVFREETTIPERNKFLIFWEKNKKKKKKHG